MGKFNRGAVLAIVGAALWGLTVTGAMALPITVPPSLNVGDQYRLAFVTSGTHDATSTDIAVYNNFVSGEAAGQSELAALGTTWKAIASTLDVDARDNTDTNPIDDGAGVPIFLLDGTILATVNADLWDGSPASAFDKTQSGDPKQTLRRVCGPFSIAPLRCRAIKGGEERQWSRERGAWRQSLPLTW